MNSDERSSCRGALRAEAWLLTDANPQVRANGFYRHLGWVGDGIQEDEQVRYMKTLADTGRGRR